MIRYLFAWPHVGRASVALLLLAGALLTLGPALGGGKKSDSEVKVTAAATKPDASGKQVVTVNLDINKGWYCYANPVGQELLESAQTKVTVVSTKGKLQDVKISYPKGKLKKDATVGDYSIYEGHVAIQANVQRAAGDTAPLELTVHLNTCNLKGFCLPPAMVKLLVP
jgi:DsbC/DsbD-like thiol-disulfide interchange protein